MLEVGNVNISCPQELEASGWRVVPPAPAAGLALDCEAVLVALQPLPERENFLSSEQCSKFHLGQTALCLAQMSSNYVPDFSGRG